MIIIRTIAEISRLSFFKAERYEYENYTFDASCFPRPHFCMGLLISGKATFRDCTGSGEVIELLPGDMIFVPITTRYISEWVGDPTVSYISLHFIFDLPGIFNRHKSFKLQKYTSPEPEKLLADFEFILEKYASGEKDMLSALSRFFGILGTILPSLATECRKPIDMRITKAIEYIEENYSDTVTVDAIAASVNMSPSRFYPCFKDAVGVTPIDYLNHYRVNRAIMQLVNDDSMSIENISALVGFESSTYFRRVFKRITGKSPRDYRRISAEI